MTIDAMEYRASVLQVKCTGSFGEGSKGNPSGELVRSSIERWLAAHPDDRVEQIEVDYSDVDYSWGDGPLSSLVPFIRQGVRAVRLIAGPRNLDALESLVRTSGLPWVTVRKRDS